MRDINSPRTPSRQKSAGVSDSQGGSRSGSPVSQRSLGRGMSSASYTQRNSVVGSPARRRTAHQHEHAAGVTGRQQDESNSTFSAMYMFTVVFFRVDVSVHNLVPNHYYCRDVVA